MPMYLSVHRQRSPRFNTAASMLIVASELARWSAIQSIDMRIKASGIAADTHRYIMVADFPDDDAALAMALHLDIHLNVETELTRLIGDLRALAERSGDEFGGIE